MNFWWNMKNCTLCTKMVLCLAIYTALCHNSEKTSITIYSEYNNTAILPCIALSYSKDYTSITWYKLPKEEGIIRNSKRRNITQLYKNYENRTDVILTEEGSLVLVKVDFSQAGRYKCYLAGKVGYRNNDSYVTLNVTESVTETTPALNITTDYFLHSTKMNSSMLALPVDVTPMSVLAGFFSLSLSKVLLCYACVWGMAKYKKHQRRKLWS